MTAQPSTRSVAEESGEINAQLEALCAKADAEGRGLTVAEEARRRELLVASYELWGDELPAWLASSAPNAMAAGQLTRAQREEVLWPSGATRAEREALLAVRPVERATPTAEYARVSPMCHRRAVDRAWARAAALAGHEAAHAFIVALEGGRVLRLGFRYSSSDFAHAYVESGFCAIDGIFSAVAAVAGGVWTEITGTRCPVGRRSQGDEEHLRAALGDAYSFDSVRQAETTARRILECHRETVGALAMALMATGRLEGRELERLLAPVRRRAA
jgi:hypothetical protein